MNATYHRNCTKCGIEKPLEEFTPRLGGAFGRRARCKTCMRNYNRQYQEENFAKFATYKQDYYQEHLDWFTAYRRKYRKDKAGEIAAKNREYRQQNVIKRATSGRLYYQKNRRSILARTYKTNQRRRQTDPLFRAIEACRRRVNKAINGKAKAGKTLELIGCSSDFLRHHLESQFSEGMTWANYGFGINKWHVDHILPCASFDLSKEEEQHRCFHYSNLQPLWQSANLTKSCKIPPAFVVFEGAAASYIDFRDVRSVLIEQPPIPAS